MFALRALGIGDPLTGRPALRGLTPAASGWNLTYVDCLVVRHHPAAAEPDLRREADERAGMPAGPAA